MTDEEIIALAEKTREEKYCLKFNNCWECPLFKQYGQSSECLDSKYRGSFYTKIFLDGFKAAYNILKIDVNKLTIGDVRCAIKQSPQYAELLLRSIGEEFRAIIIRNYKKHNDNN